MALNVREKYDLLRAMGIWGQSEVALSENRINLSSKHDRYQIDRSNERCVMGTTSSSERSADEEDEEAEARVVAEKEEEDSVFEGGGGGGGRSRRTQRGEKARLSPNGVFVSAYDFAHLKRRTQDLPKTECYVPPKSSLKRKRNFSALR